MTKILSVFLIMFLAIGSATAAKYPAHWWQVVPRDTAPDWEILPQDANDGEVILSKRNELGILSNFAETPFRFEGKEYPGVEGLWQSMKYPEDKNDPRYTHPGIQWKYTRAEVAQMTGFDAKRAGSLASDNMKKMDINWVTYKGVKMTYRTTKKAAHYRLIKRIMSEKLLQNAEVKKILLATGNLVLMPDHKQRAGTPPAWKYNQIWMEFRSQIQDN
jgi:predicted NAD-dependent protein-ADP-ribosyltransferase YbiA (DUF1768 family)